MRKLTIEISDATYEQMARQAELMNKTPVILVTDLLLAAYGNGVLHSANGQSSEAIIQSSELVNGGGRFRQALPTEETEELSPGTAYMNGNSENAAKTIREILEEEDMLESSDSDFTEFTVPDISIETARNILAKAGGPSLTEILDEQRGPKL